MKRMELDQQLNECLLEIENGASLSEVLSKRDDPTGELRQMLYTAQEARALARHISVPAAAQNRSRSQFLSQIAARTEARRKAGWRWLPFLAPARLAAVLAVIVIVLASGWFGTGLVSADALPGEPLYGVKLAVEQARLRMVSGMSSRLHLEETFDQRRVDETARLLAQSRQQPVFFAGPLSRTEDGSWRIAGIPADIPEQIEPNLENVVGLYIEVEGATASNSVQVSQARLRLFHVEGKITDLRADEWTVDGVRVRIVPETHLLSTPVIGQRVVITALRTGDTLVALAARPFEDSALPDGAPTQPVAAPF